MCARVLTNHSDLSAVISASNSPAQRTRSESMLIYLHLFSCLPLSSLTVHAFHLLPCFTPLITSYFSVIVFLLTPSLPVTSCHCLISSPFFLSPPFPPSVSSPPSLTPQLGSTMRWQRQGCVVRCGVFVCVMSHYSSSIVALSFLIPMLTDHTAILRFYKPFQRSFDGESLSAYCAPSVFGEKE